MNHTPGPWLLSKVLYPAEQDVSFEVLASGRLVVQTIMREVVVEDGAIAQDEANARLVSAAPMLFDACKLARGWIGLDGDGITDPTRTFILAAIAKAEGTS